MTTDQTPESSAELRDQWRAIHREFVSTVEKLTKKLDQCRSVISQLDNLAHELDSPAFQTTADKVRRIRDELMKVSDPT